MKSGSLMMMNTERFLGKPENEPSQPVAGYPLLPPELQGQIAGVEPVDDTFHIAFVHNTHGYGKVVRGQELPTFFKWIAPY